MREIGTMVETHNTGFYELRRETSKYNKYMKWHVLFFHKDRSVLSSNHFRTRKEAQAEIDHSIWLGKRGFPIGRMMSYTDYEEKNWKEAV